MKESLIPILPLVLGQMPSVSATELGQWLFCAACVLVILNYGISFWKNISGGLQKKQSARDDVYPSLSDCERKHSAISSQISELSTDAQSRSENLRLELKEDIKGIHKRIDAVFNGILRLERKNES